MNLVSGLIVEHEEGSTNHRYLQNSLLDYHQIHHRLLGASFRLRLVLDQESVKVSKCFQQLKTFGLLCCFLP